MSLWRIFLGEGKLGPMWVDLNVWSWWSIEIPDAFIEGQGGLYGFKLVFNETIRLRVEG